MEEENLDDDFSSSFQPDHTSNVIEEVIVETIHDHTNICEIYSDMEVEEQVQDDTEDTHIVAFPATTSFRQRSPSPHHEIVIDQTVKEPSGICIINVNKDPDPGGTSSKKIRTSDSPRNKLWKQPTLLKVGDCFNSFTEVEEAVMAFEKEQGITYWKRNVLTMEKAKNKYVCLRINNPNLKYYRIDYNCLRGGRKFTQKNKTFRRTSRSVRRGCDSIISFQASRESNSLVIVKLNTYHNHPRADFSSLSKNKKLTADELEEVSRILLTGHNKNALVDHVREMTGKRITKKDLYNIETRLRKSVPKVFEESLLMLAQNSAENMEIIEDSEGCFEGFILQDKHMKAKFAEFPEFLFVDSRYRLNNFKVPLYIHFIMDGHREVEIVAVFVSLNLENIENFVSTFTQNNPASDKTRIIFTDRDIYERPEYPDFFPKATVDLCMFQVLYNMKKDINCNLDIKSDQKYICYNLLEKIAYSNSKSEFVSNVQNLLEAKIEPAIDYFMQYCNHNKESWVLALKTFTCYDKLFIQRLEKVHTELKKIFPAKLLNQNLRMSELTYFIRDFQKVIRYITIERKSRIENILKNNHENISELSESVKEYALILTPYALSVVMQQMDLSQEVDIPKIPKSATSVVMQTSNETTTITAENCTCELYSIAQLPCLHIFAFRHAAEKDFFFTDAIADRWMLDYYCTEIKEIDILSVHDDNIEEKIENIDESLCDDPILSEQIMNNEVKNSVAMKTCKTLSKLVSNLPQDEFKKKMGLLNHLLEMWQKGHEVHLLHMRNSEGKSLTRKNLNIEACCSQDERRENMASNTSRKQSEVIENCRDAKIGDEEHTENLEDPRVQEELLTDNYDVEDDIVERDSKKSQKVDCKKNIGQIKCRGDLSSSIPRVCELVSTKMGAKVHKIEGIVRSNSRETTSEFSEDVSFIPQQLPGGAHLIRESELKKQISDGSNSLPKDTVDISIIPTMEHKKREDEPGEDPTELVLIPIQIKFPSTEQMFTIYSPIAPKNLIKEELSVILKFPAVIKCLSQHPLRAAKAVQRMLYIALEEQGIHVPQQLLQEQQLRAPTKAIVVDQASTNHSISQLNKNNTEEFRVYYGKKPEKISGVDDEFEKSKQQSQLINEIAVVPYVINVKTKDDVTTAMTVYVPADIVGKIDIQQVLEYICVSKCPSDDVSCIRIQEILNGMLENRGFVIPEQLQNPQNFFSTITKLVSEDDDGPMEYSAKESPTQSKLDSEKDKALVFNNSSETNKPYFRESENNSIPGSLNETIETDSESDSMEVDFVETIIEDYNSSNASIDVNKEGDTIVEDLMKSFKSMEDGVSDQKSIDNVGIFSANKECGLLKQSINTCISAKQSTSFDIPPSVIPVGIKDLKMVSLSENVPNKLQKFKENPLTENVSDNPQKFIQFYFFKNEESSLTKKDQNSSLELDDTSLTENVANDSKICKEKAVIENSAQKPPSDTPECILGLESLISSRSGSRTDTRSSFDSESTLSCDLTENVLDNIQHFEENSLIVTEKIQNSSQNSEERSLTETVVNYSNMCDENYFTENTANSLQRDSLECIPESHTFSRSSFRSDTRSSIDSESSLSFDFEGF